MNVGILLGGEESVNQGVSTNGCREGNGGHSESLDSSARGVGEK